MNPSLIRLTQNDDRLASAHHFGGIRERRRDDKTRNHNTREVQPDSRDFCLYLRRRPSGALMTGQKGVFDFSLLNLGIFGVSCDGF